MHRTGWELGRLRCIRPAIKHVQGATGRERLHTPRDGRAGSIGNGGPGALLPPYTAITAHALRPQHSVGCLTRAALSAVLRGGRGRSISGHLITTPLFSTAANGGVWLAEGRRRASDKSGERETGRRRDGGATGGSDGVTDGETRDGETRGGERRPPREKIICALVPPGFHTTPISPHPRTFS